MKVEYSQLPSGLWTCFVLGPYTGNLLDLPGWGWAESRGATKAEARENLQEHINAYLVHVQGIGVKALNLVTRSQP